MEQKQPLNILSDEDEFLLSESAKTWLRETIKTAINKSVSYFENTEFVDFFNVSCSYCDTGINACSICPLRKWLNQAKTSLGDPCSDWLAGVLGYGTDYCSFRTLKANFWDAVNLAFAVSLYLYIGENL